jgi:hypothetical protein
VSRLVGDIDKRVNAFLTRPIEGEWRYVWIDATYVWVRQGGRIVNVAVIVATGANTEGRREVLGLAVGPSEAEPFWKVFSAFPRRSRIERCGTCHGRRSQGAQSRCQENAARVSSALSCALHAQIVSASFRPDKGRWLADIRALLEALAYSASIAWRSSVLAMASRYCRHWARS